MDDVFNGLTAEDFVSDADTKIEYSDEITKAVSAKSKITQLMSTTSGDSGKIIKTVLETSKNGSIVGITLQDELIGEGATGNVTADASSEELAEIKQFIKVDRWQHKIPSNEDIVSQRSSDKFKNNAKNSAKNWGTRKWDKVFFNVMSADCTNIVCAGHHDTHTCSAITKADVLTTADVEEARRRAELGVDALGKEVPPVQAVQVNQDENAGYYSDLPIWIMLVGTNTARHIKNDENWAEARREAHERSKSNPIFTGALGFWDGVLLLPVGNDTKRSSGILTSKSAYQGFSNVKSSDLSIYGGKVVGEVAQETEINLFLGVGACHIVLDKGVNYYDFADKDDPRRMNVMIDRVYGLAKTKYKASDNDGVLKDSMFDGKDYGVIAVVSSTGL